MGSIYSLVKGRKFDRLGPLSAFQAELVADAADHAAACILVDAQSSFLEVLKDADALEFNKLPITPPFRNMWIEGRFIESSVSLRVGIQVRRRTGVERGVSSLPWMLDLSIWEEFQGCALLPLSVVLVGLDSDGSLAQFQFIDAGAADRGDWSPGWLPGAWKGIRKSLPAAVLAVTCHVLAKMNCKNVELVPRENAKPSSGRLKPLAALASVWRVFQIKEAPRSKGVGAGESGLQQCVEHRLRWIRGHYADYRKGSGLFGNSKLRCVFWFPERQVGNRELGEEIPEYEVE